MKVFLIIVLACVIVLAWLWPKKPQLKGAPARTWPAPRRGKIAKHKLTTPL
jgi:hypothetical protein